ncbi:hypothetical protein [Bacillus thuringiensis]|uniref:hypothetical protein n=1 Tax=Bacillus thuringiensis TaxID=1428 RepID=UPI00333BF717
MQPGKYGREHEMMQIRTNHPSSLEGMMESAATLDQTDQVQSSVSFCAMIQVPDGFVYVPSGIKQFAYSLSGVSIVTETSPKTIAVENCGPVDVQLHLLKVVGSIPYVVNAQVQGEYGKKDGASAGHENQIGLSYTGHIPVNTVLKLSVANLPDYQIEEKNVVISSFDVTPVQEQEHHYLRFTGTLTFRNIP